MKCVRLAALALGIAAAVGARHAMAVDPVKHESTATSSATVTVASDGTVTMTARNARLIPYTLFNTSGDHPTVFPRLATVVTDVRKRSDAEGEDPASSVSVTIDDLSGATPRRLAEFTDPGSRGELVGERYFASTVSGCCGGSDKHVVRATETGRLLFKSTGPGELGRVVWADMPNARPPLTRWAAFNGDIDEDGLAHGVIGTLFYGGESGATSSLQIRMKAAKDALTEKNLELGTGADLVWIDGKHPSAKPEFQSGDVGSPATMWIAEGAKSAEQVGGFSLALRLGKASLAVIPILADHLVVREARLSPGISLTEIVQPR